MMPQIAPRTRIHVRESPQEQDTDESIPWTVDVTGYLESGQTIDGPVSAELRDTGTDEDHSDLIIGGASTDGISRVTARVEGLEAGHRYELKWKFEISGVRWAAILELICAE